MLKQLKSTVVEKQLILAQRLKQQTEPRIELNTYTNLGNMIRGILHQEGKDGLYESPFRKLLEKKKVEIKLLFLQMTRNSKSKKH